MDVPTSAEIRAWSLVDFGALGFPEGDPRMDGLIARAAAYMAAVTGRGFGEPPSPGEAVATWQEPLANQLIQRSVEVLAYQAQEDVIETVADFMLLSGFTAGSYSETRRSLTELKDAQMLHSDPTMDALIKALMTPEKLEAWEAWVSDEVAPAWAISEVDWSGTAAFGHDHLPFWAHRDVHEDDWQPA